MQELDLLSVPEASAWASSYLHKNVTTANILYLIQYGRVRKFGTNGNTKVDKVDLEKYYQSCNLQSESLLKAKLGSDLNWHLSFAKIKEADTTKHVHRLHPYKGKFIPQLVEYFLDQHTDEFKHVTYFCPGDTVLDPFCGSGTTLVQANELGIHALGVDVSIFNTMISNCKIEQYNYNELCEATHTVTKSLKQYVASKRVLQFEEELLQELNVFNRIHFSVPEYKYKLYNKEIDENRYSLEKERMFLPVYERLVAKYGIKLCQGQHKSFLDKWFLPNVRNELEFVQSQLKQIANGKIRLLLNVILSRTMRSCRATTHADLATLIDPVVCPYYCKKHGKICKPLFSIMKWWESYTRDTLQRLAKFNSLRTATYQKCITGDSRNIDFVQVLHQQNQEFAKHIDQKKVRGIFSSPPYVGLIDYHEQHAYAYDLFELCRNDVDEIGPLYKGQGRDARGSYVCSIATVLNNCKAVLVDNYDVFLVANDKYNLYEQIATQAGMKIVNRYKRPVLNRTEKDKTAYAEIVFHLKQR